MSDELHQALAVFFSAMALLTIAAVIIFYLQACKAEIRRHQ